jgi:chromosomal replication initiator protein
MQTRGQWILLPENRAARQAVEQVLECVSGRSTRRSINPLFLHGPAGTGKTHLVSDLVAHLTRQAPDLQVVVLQASDIPPARPAQPGEDVAAARAADLVVVEDIQHLNERAVEPFVALLDRCLARQRQLVCTASVGPARLSHLPGRLTSRLVQGLVVGLELLSPASRREYLQRAGSVNDGALCVAHASDSLALPDILDWLAEHTPGSVRQLQGALVRLNNLTAVLGRVPHPDEVSDAFRQDSEGHAPTMERIAQRVCRYFQVAPGQVRSPRRSREVMLPRQVGMYLARQLTSLSLEQIGAYFGGRDHTTVLHACRKVENALTSDAHLCGAVRELRADLA